MSNITEKSLIGQRIGMAEPIAVRGIKARPDNRQLSARWLAGTFLTGITSSALMGVALLAALTTGKAIETPTHSSSLANNLENSRTAGANGAKSNRILSNFTVPQPADRKRMELSTLIRSNERSIVRTTPFMLAKIDLSASRAKQRQYPPFDALNVFKTTSSGLKAAEGTIYGAALENNIAVANSPFSAQGRIFDTSNLLTSDDVEEIIRNQAALLNEGETQSAALSYVNPERFAGYSDVAALTLPINMRIVPENVSVANRDNSDDTSIAADTFNEIFVPISTNMDFSSAFEKGGLDKEIVEPMAKALAILLKTDEMRPGMILRASVVESAGDYEVVRASVYEGDRHLMSVSINDQGQFVPAKAPEVPLDLDLATTSPKPQSNKTNKSSTIYDAIYRSAFAYGATDAMGEQLIRLFASELDYRAPVKTTDRLELFFSYPDENGRATEESAMLYVKAILNKRELTFYSFKMADGTVDFFSPEGRSGRPFLLRNPVPSGKFRSGFGMRRHPITRVNKLHTGVDWSAPRGTPILASGDGIVVSAGWAGGYGRQTKIRHANGYVSSYSHQNNFANGIKKGASVRQGQVIGFVGTTGLSTGNHLHYEILVNENKVDPMRVRLPESHVLKGAELARFEDERDRIDALLNDEGDGTKLASIN